MQNKVPVLDILYCNSNIDEHLFSAFNPNKMEYDCIQLDKAERELRTKILDYFTKCTVATSSPVANTIYKSLVKKKVKHHFKRAVVYPLFPNLDENTYNSVGFLMVQMLLITKHTLPNAPYWLHFFISCLNENKCNYCKCTKEGLKKCSKCHLVQYCDTNCQRMYWKTHKPFCNTPTSHDSSWRNLQLVLIVVLYKYTIYTTLHNLYNTS